MLMFPLKSTVLERDLGRQVAGLFGAGEQGGWYDVSDMSTLFQDAAGATPVTAVEQPVGLILDKSGRGNHAAQATTTKRPVYSRRVNLLANSEFSGASAGAPGNPPTEWINGGITGEIVESPSGIRFKTTNTRRTINQPYLAPAQVITCELVAKVFVHSSTQTHQLLTVVGASVASVAWSIDGVASPGNTLLTTGPHELKATAVSTGVAGNFIPSIGVGAQSNDPSGDVTFYTADFRLNIDAHLPYQRVNTATDYDADPAKFPAYLRFDGVDDALQTGNIDFTSTDKTTVWAGYAKLNDGPTSVLLETGANYGGGGGIGMFASNSSSTNFAVAHSDIGGNRVSNFVSAATEIGVATVRYDLQAGARTSVRNNSGAWSFASTASGGGMLGNRPLYIGARAGTGLYFNGRLYSLILRGAQTPLSQIEAAELYIKQKMRMP